MVRARLVLQLALATVAAMLSLYFWLRAIGGEPTAPVAQKPIPRFEGHIVHAVVIRPRARPHASARHGRSDARRSGLTRKQGTQEPRSTLFL